MNEEIKQLLNEVDTLKIQLSALRPLPEEALKKIQDALDIEYTYESNRIEGNTLTLQETALIVNEGVTISGKSMREHLEAINHTEAISYIKDIAKQDIEISERTIKEIHALILHGIDRENAGKYRDALMAEYHKYPALPPVFDFMDNEAPDKVRKMKPVWTEDGYLLFWTAPKYKDEMDRAVQYVIYRFDAKEKVDISDPSHIVAITRDNFYKLPYENGKTKYRYVVTALDRLHNESKVVAKKVKL